MGSTIITKCISNNLIIDPAQTLPLTCSEFIQYVLIPETAIMLILEDREGITYEQAKKINEESTEFGNFVHDVELNDLE
ncbi:MAG TPA: hypothetical protein VJ697_08165 [Nitrososphaeraceae archaeon]|nr:hypothetical protein [Nitrososphaeraceae archaeon]